MFISNTSFFHHIIFLFFFSWIFNSVTDTKTGKCTVGMDADVSSSFDCIGCWLTIPTTNAVAFSVTGSSFLAVASVAVMICHWNFEWHRVHHALRINDESRCNHQRGTVIRDPIVFWLASRQIMHRVNWGRLVR